jgi:hypothetical protein
MRAANDLFRDVAVQAGEQRFKESDIFTRRQLSQDMLNDFAQRGVQSITYKNGKKVSIEAYSEMVGRTMSGHAAVQASLNRYEEYGYDLVRVSSHFRACPLCVPWEGQILSQSGLDYNYSSLDDAIASGLFHPNCAHDITAYFPGLSPDQELRVDPEEQKLINQHGYKKAQEIAYKAQQQQRYIERNIRNWKMKEITALDDAAKAKAHRKVLEWRKAQRNHLAKNPFLPRKYEREAVKGWAQVKSVLQPTSPRFTDAELRAVTFYKEGQDGWGYQAIRYADMGKLDEYGPIERLRNRELYERAEELKAEYERLYRNFASAVRKAHALSSDKEAVRFVNTFNIPKVGETIHIEKFRSFTLDPSCSMVEHFGGTDKLVYKMQGSKDLADISNVGYEFVAEQEAVLRKAINVKVVDVRREKIEGVWHYVAYLE